MHLTTNKAKYQCIHQFTKNDGQSLPSCLSLSVQYLNLIHELHSLNDADSLTLGDFVPFLAEGGLSRGWRPVEAACHGRCHLQHSSSQHIVYCKMGKLAFSSRCADQAAPLQWGCAPTSGVCSMSHVTMSHVTPKIKQKPHILILKAGPDILYYQM